MITEGMITLLYEGTKTGLRFLAKATLEGILKDVCGQPIPGCRVSLFGQDYRRSYSDESAPSGRFIITGVRSGQYDIQVDSPQRSHSYTRFDKVLLKPGAQKEIEVTLPFNPTSEIRKIGPQRDDSFVGINVACDGGVLPKEGMVGTQFIRATPGREYTLLAHNYTTRSVLCVLTVDGLSVMDGRPGDFRSGGYIVDPGRVVEIKGWRIDEERVARFVFANEQQAYARLMNEPTDLGVIGCAFFLEKPRYIDTHSDIRFSREGPVGTGFGRQEEQRVEFVDFDREERPFYLTRLLYIHKEERRLSIEAEAKNPFPGCRTPPGWKG